MIRQAVGTSGSARCNQEIRSRVSVSVAARHEADDGYGSEKTSEIDSSEKTNKIKASFL